MFQRQQPPNSADRLYINAAEFRLCINTAGVLGGQLPFVLHIHGDLARLQLVEVASVGFPTAQLGYAASRGSTGRLERFCRAVRSMHPRRFRETSKHRVFFSDFSAVAALKHGLT